MAVFIAAGASLMAADNTFPSGGGDISSAADWGLPEVPSGVVGFPLGSPYGVSNAVTFAGMELSGSSGDASAFSFAPGASITLNGNTATDLNFSSSGLMATFKGGSLSVTKGSRIGYDKIRNNALVLDGCSFTHSGSTFMVGASASTGNAVVLTNGASAAFSTVEISDNGGHDNRLEVNAGCTVTVGGHLMSDYYGTRAADDSSLLLVRGAGASLTMASGKNIYVGWRHDNNTVTVADGAALSLSGSSSVLQFGYAASGSGASPCGYGALNVLDSATVSCYQLNMKYSACNTITVSNATLSAGYATYVGVTSGYGTNTFVASGPSAVVGATRLNVAAEAGCDHNIVRILDGATLNSMAAMRLGHGGAFNELVVSNATLNAAGFVIGKWANASNNVLRIMGPNASFSLTKDSWDADGMKGYFGNGGGGLIEYSDHCVVSFSHAKSSFIGSLSNGNTVRVTGGAQVTEPNPVVGNPPRADSEATTGNRLEILDGATFTLVRPFVKGVGNGIVISNATLISSNSQTNTFVVGEALDSDGDIAAATSNNFIRLEGESPKIRAAQAGAGFRILNRSRIEFVLPATPYAEAPLRGCQLHLDDTSDIVFDFSVLDAVQHGPQKYRLFETTTANEKLKDLLSAEALARANARLSSRGASIAWEGSGVGSALVLSVKGNRGTILILR